MSAKKTQKPRLLFNKVRQNKFLKNYAKTGRKLHSAELTGISIQVVRDHEKKDPTFKEKVSEALECFAEVLEEAATKRSVEGVNRIIAQKGEVVWHDGKPLTETTYSDSLLAMQLKAAKPDKYREKSSVLHEGDYGVLVVEKQTAAEIDEALSALRKKSMEEG